MTAPTGSLVLAGSHRGGTALVARADVQAVSHFRQVIFVDPVPGRADHLADVARRKFPSVRVRSIADLGETIVAKSGDGDTTVSSVDSLNSTIAMIEAKGDHQHLIYQIVGRGPGGNGGVRLGLSTSLHPGDADAVGSSLLLLRALRDLSEPVSSEQLTRAGDPVTALMLKPLREQVTRTSISRLRTIDAALPAHAITLGGGAVPLFISTTEPGSTVAARKALAIDVATAGWSPFWQVELVVVMIVGSAGRQIDLFQLRRLRNSRVFVTGLSELRAPERRAVTPAMFTD